MELPSAHDAADLGDKGGKISDGMHAQAKNDDNNSDMQTPATPIVPLEINIPEIPSPKVRDISYIKGNEAKFDQRYDSEGHSGPYVPLLVETVNEEEKT